MTQLLKLLPNLNLWNMQKILQCKLLQLFQTMFLKQKFQQMSVEHEKKILTEQVVDSGKPANVAEKIVEGRMKKFFKEICLLDQPYVKDGDMSVQQYNRCNRKRARRRY